MDSTRDKPIGAGWRILIVGTGGQGALTAARVLTEAFVAHGHNVVSGQLHGMAQRGGSVQSSVMIDCGISPMIPAGRADFVLGFEPVETARALPLMSARTVVYMNTARVIPYILGQRAVLGQEQAEYPEVEQLAAKIQAISPRLSVFDATALALEAGSAKALNVVMLGCLLGSGALALSADVFWDTIAERMPPRLMEPNRRAFFAGARVGEQLRRGERTS
ncbi:MAG: indolepyruvate oxidoreductase subunit beta [Planctomycetes bacterium]|nr:indolepyruvate oxidoreductase subunit beta [Planctomycetota bacterium]